MVVMASSQFVCGLKNGFRVGSAWFPGGWPAVSAKIKKMVSGWFPRGFRVVSGGFRKGFGGFRGSGVCNVPQFLQHLVAARGAVRSGQVTLV